MRKTYYPNGSAEFTAEELLPCPFCGWLPKVKFIGNEHTKSREVEIKCSNAFCRITHTGAGRMLSQQEIFLVSLEAWNKRTKD